MIVLIVGSDAKYYVYMMTKLAEKSRKNYVLWVRTPFDNYGDRQGYTNCGSLAALL